MELLLWYMVNDGLTLPAVDVIVVVVLGFKYGLIELANLVIIGGTRMVVCVCIRIAKQEGKEEEVEEDGKCGENRLYLYIYL